MGADQWDDAKRQALKVLRRKARERDTITYSDFVRRIKAIPDLGYHRDSRLDRLLDEIALAEDGAGRGLISALVVEVAAPHQPSHGFYELAGQRHPPGTNRTTIFEAERDAVWAAHEPAS